MGDGSFLSQAYGLGVLGSGITAATNTTDQYGQSLAWSQLQRQLYQQSFSSYTTKASTDAMVLEIMRARGLRNVSWRYSPDRDAILVKGTDALGGEKRYLLNAITHELTEDVEPSPRLANQVWLDTRINEIRVKF